jgi:hypothetical protein
VNYSGLAKIIPFAPRTQVRVGPPWSSVELGELFRVAHVLRQSGIMIETDMGLSDEGDPWFVFFATQTEDVIAHFARINGEIVVHGLSASGVVSGVDLADVVRRLQPVQSMETQQRSQADRSVVFHPFMLLVAFVAASFLATEESQAAAPVSTAVETPDRSVEVAKTKSDWIDRAIALLNNKPKDRSDAAGGDVPGSRKLSANDAAQHSMALVMLAAAITQAQQIDAANATDDALNNRVETKAATIPTKLAADDSFVKDDMVAALDAAPQNSTRFQAPAQAIDHNAIDYGRGGDSPGTENFIDVADYTVGLQAPSSAVTPGPIGATSEASQIGALPASVSANGTLALPEIVPIGATSVTVNAASGLLVGKSVVSAFSIMSTGPTSFDVTLESGILLFHQTIIYTQSVDTISLQGLGKDGADNTMPLQAPGGTMIDPNVKGQDGSLAAWVAAGAEQVLTLTDTKDSILVGAGHFKIKNFAFGVDQLVMQDSSVMVKAPEVLLSYAGDIIIKFSPTTQVTLIGMFNPAEMVSGAVSAGTG